jgi:L-threonylcarbamoyladenylate synthase
MSVRRIALQALLDSPSRLAELSRLIDGGGVVAVPTETFYGLAARPDSGRGVERIFAAKGRPAEKALPVLVGEVAQLPGLGVAVPPERLARFLALWPAPLTVVLALSRPIACSGGEPSLAVRIPAHAGLRRILLWTGPLTGTSANRSGAPPMADPDDVARAFDGWIDAILDGGPTPGGSASTLVDGRFEPARLLRAGAFPWPPERSSGGESG